MYEKLKEALSKLSITTDLLIISNVALLFAVANLYLTR